MTVQNAEIAVEEALKVKNGFHEAIFTPLEGHKSVPRDG